MKTAKYVVAGGALLALVLVSRWALQPLVDPPPASTGAAATPQAASPGPDAPAADAPSPILTCPSAPLKTRIEVVRTLGAVAAIQPEALGVLAWWFHHETEAQVREMIGRFVPVDQLAVR